MSEPLLSIRDLRTHFATDDGVVKAVDGVSLEVERGEIVGLVGESGSGKSVLSLSVLQLIPQPPGYFPSGSIRLEGRELVNASQSTLRKVRGNRVSMIFQDPMTCLNPFMKIERQLTEILELHQRMTRRQARTKSIEMLERVGIPDPSTRIDNFPHEFSGGMRQRVMIAMALLCEPALLIADEPTTALDVTIQAQILELIRDLVTDSQTSVVLITHDLGVVAGMADRVAVMYAGRLIEHGETSDLFAHAKHPYTQGLLQSIPTLDGDRKNELIPIEGLPPDLSDLPPGCPFAPRCHRSVDRCGVDYPEVVTFAEGRWAACWETTP